MPIPKTTTKAEQEEELRRIGINGDDGDDGELDARSSVRPKTMADLDPAKIYAAFNRRTGKTLADGDSD